MQKSITKTISDNSFWLSVLLHLLFLFLLLTSYVYTHQEEQQKPPNLYVPSYVYKGAITPSAHQQTKTNPTVRSTQHVQQPVKEASEQKDLPTEKNGIHQKSVMAATQEVLQDYQREAVRSLNADEDPIYLIGDENQVADPLIKLMGRAISAHFAYPSAAGELGIKGTVLVGLVLHPEGYLSHIQMMRSSGNQDLDNAALYAVNTALKVVGADRFISKPKHFVIGFIFR